MGKGVIYIMCHGRARVAANPNPNRQYSQQNLHENFASDHLVNTYLTDQLNVFGQNR